MDDEGRIAEETSSSLRRTLMSPESIVISSEEEEPTSALTTEGTASGPLVGGNLDMIATAAGWALPDLSGAILLIEAVGMYLGQVDRLLTMLRKGGHLAGVKGIAVGQFTNFKPSGGITIIDLLRDHLGQLKVPILGGLPLGHGKNPLSVPIGARTFLDTASRNLILNR